MNTADHGLNYLYLCCDFGSTSLTSEPILQIKFGIECICYSVNERWICSHEKFFFSGFILVFQVQFLVFKTCLT